MAETPYQILYNPNSPHDERFDAKSEATKQVINSGLLDKTHINYEAINMLVKASRNMAKNQQNNDKIPSRGVMPSTGNYKKNTHLRDRHYLERPGLTFNKLEWVAKNNPIQQAIIATMSRVASLYSESVNYDYELGFKIKLKGRKDHTLSDSERDRIDWLEKFIKNCGAEFNPFARTRLRRDEFKDWIKKSVRDSLTYDAMPIEIVRTESGKLHGWHHIDATTIFPVQPQDYEIMEKPYFYNPYTDEELPEYEEVQAVEAIDGIVASWLTYDDLIYKVRNPMTQPENYGWGISETEMVMRTIAGLINLLNYNYRSYEENHIPRGFLQIFGNYNPDDVEEFKEEWRALISGEPNSFQAPVLVSQEKEAGAEFITTGDHPEEMMFQKSLAMEVAVECAVYGIAPEQIHFESFSTKTSSLSDPSVEGKIENANIQGLLPLKQYIRGCINHILSDVDDEASLSFTGDEDEESVISRVSQSLTFGEARENNGLAEVDLKELNECPTDPTMANIYMQLLQQEQQEVEQGEPQLPPEEGQEAPQEEEGQLAPEELLDEPQEEAQEEQIRGSIQPSLFG